MFEPTQAVVLLVHRNQAADSRLTWLCVHTGEKLAQLSLRSIVRQKIELPALISCYDQKTYVWVSGQLWLIDGNRIRRLYRGRPIHEATLEATDETVWMMGGYYCDTERKDAPQLRRFNLATKTWQDFVLKKGQDFPPFLHCSCLSVDGRSIIVVAGGDDFVHQQAWRIDLSKTPPTLHALSRHPHGLHPCSSLCALDPYRFIAVVANDEDSAITPEVFSTHPADLAKFGKPSEQGRDGVWFGSNELFVSEQNDFSFLHYLDSVSSFRDGDRIVALEELKDRKRVLILSVRAPPMMLYQLPKSDRGRASVHVVNL